MVQLCQLSDVKAYLGITSDGDDEILTRLIESASELAEIHCGRSFAIQTYTHEVRARGARSLFLLHGPVVSIDGVSMGASTLGASRYYREGRELFLEGGMLWAEKVVVTYKAGYAQPPKPVEQAVLETVALRYREKPRIGMASRAMEGVSESYITAALTPSAREALNPYREVVA